MVDVNPPSTSTLRPHSPCQHLTVAVKAIDEHGSVSLDVFSCMLGGLVHLNMRLRVNVDSFSEN